jgi:hypothetical protein
LAVKYYKLKSKIFEKALILVTFSLVNTIIIAIGVLFHGTYDNNCYRSVISWHICSA